MKKDEELLRVKEIELFGDDVVKSLDKKVGDRENNQETDFGNDKKEKVEGENEPLKAPEGFGIVYSESTPSAFQLHSTRFQSREMPLLAVEELEEVVGLKRRRRQKTQNNVLDEIRRKQESSKTTRFDSKCFIGEREATSSSKNEDGSLKNNDESSKRIIIPEWRDRVSLGNGFGILLDPHDEYSVLDDDDDADENENNSSSSCSTTTTEKDVMMMAAENDNFCYMPPLVKSNKKRRAAQLSAALAGGGEMKKKKKKNKSGSTKSKKEIEKLLSGSNRKFW